MNTETKQVIEETPIKNVFTKNIPYVKVYNELGEVENPITPIKPYINQSPYNRRKRRAMGLA